MNLPCRHPPAAVLVRVGIRTVVLRAGVVIIEHQLAHNLYLAADEPPQENIRPLGLELRPIVRGHLYPDTRLLKALDLDVAGRMAVLEALGDGAVEADTDVVIRLPGAMEPTVRAFRTGVLHEVEIADHGHDISFTEVRQWDGVLGVVTARDASRRVGVE